MCLNVNQLFVWRNSSGGLRCFARIARCQNSHVHYFCCLLVDRFSNFFLLRKIYGAESGWNLDRTFSGIVGGSFIFVYSLCDNINTFSYQKRKLIFFFAVTKISNHPKSNILWLYLLSSDLSYYCWVFLWKTIRTLFPNFQIL